MIPGVFRSFLLYILWKYFNLNLDTHIAWQRQKQTPTRHPVVTRSHGRSLLSGASGDVPRNRHPIYMRYASPVSKVHGGQHGAHLGPTGPRWAPCWPHELCYLGRFGYALEWILVIHLSMACYHDDVIIKQKNFPRYLPFVRWIHQSPVDSPRGFPSQRPVTRSFDVFFDMGLNQWLSKQSRRRWFETPSRSLWRHCNVYLDQDNRFIFSVLVK